MSRRISLPASVFVVCPPSCVTCLSTVCDAREGRLRIPRTKLVLKADDCECDGGDGGCEAVQCASWLSQLRLGLEGVVRRS